MSSVQHIALIDEPLDGNRSRELSDSQLCHPLDGSATECDGLEDFPCAHTIDNANRLVLELLDIAGDKLRVQASSVVALLGSLSSRDLHFFKELLSLRLRQTNDQAREARQ